jgi:hypothetical protein
MLREDIVDAVAAGRFSLYPIVTVDEGIEIFTGRPAGIVDENGAYPPDSIHGLVAARLNQLADAAREQEHDHPHEHRKP